MNYQDKVVLITGAYQGIGKAIAEFFAKRKANVIITYHNHFEETNKLKNELTDKYHVNVDNIYLDLCEETCIANVYNYVKSKYGKLDILINNAALSLDNDIRNKSKNEFMKVMEINVVGTFFMMQYFDDIINNGYIFNISSTDGIDTGSVYSIDYNASKAAINSITKTFSLHSKNRIISICPNWVDTESTRSMDKEYLKNELKRIGQEKLINVEYIPKEIDKCINCNTLSGSIIIIGDGKDE